MVIENVYGENQEEKTEWVKVNVPVDKGISGIVSTLSSFPQLETIESCEGHNGEGSWVCFRYGSYWNSPWQELSFFVLEYLAPRLMKVVGDDANVRIQATPGGSVFGELLVRPGAIPRVETALRDLSENLVPPNVLKA